ncbi:hypothetical protein [Chryseobacterium sp. SIMBA_028]|uniref:hypothetical protein n=1 Tax=Chryseobacterium sp. SIMBA_028 TaxID=3085771 RepID=UPI00397BD8E4
MNSMIDKKTVLAIFKQHSIQVDEDSLKMIELSTIQKEKTDQSLTTRILNALKFP